VDKLLPLKDRNMRRPLGEIALNGFLGLLIV
jgi:hypothetical protein